MSTMENPDRYSDEVVDLGRYALVLAVWWREIVFGAFLFAIVGGAAALGLSVALPKYETSADVAIVPTGSAISIDDKFRAVSEEASQVRRSNQEATARRAALVGLVHNGDIAGKVIERLGDQFEGDRYLKATLLEGISAELVTIGAVSRQNQSNLIRITASADSPEKAAMFADAWAEEYVTAVNRVYEQVPQAVVIRVRNQMMLAEEVYGKIQTELEKYRLDNNTDELNRQIEMNNASLANYREIWHKTTVVLFNEKFNIDVRSLLQSYNIREKLRRLLKDALSLREQIEFAGKANTPSNDLVIQLLKIQAYTTVSQWPEGLEFPLEKNSPSYLGTTNHNEDVNAFIGSLESRIRQFDTDIAQQELDISAYLLVDDGESEVNSSRATTSRTLKKAASPLYMLEHYMEFGGVPLQKLIGELEDKNKILKSELAKIESMELGLHEEQGRRHAALQALRNEAIELQLTASAAPTQVRLASSAVEPRKSSWPSPGLVAAIIGAAWMPASVFTVLFLNALGIRPFLTRRRVT